MPAALVILRIALATVFLAASFAKLSQRSSFAESLRGFGVGGDRAVAWLAVAIPGAEAVLGFALLPAASAWAAAVGMLVLLAVFTAAIVFNLLKGRRPSCNCFGQLGAKPISAGSVVRNAVLGVLAGWIVVRGQSHSGPEIWSFVEALPAGAAIAGAAVLVVAAVLLGQTWMISQLLGQQGRLIVRLDGLELRLGNLGLVAGSETDVQAVGLAPGTLAPAFFARRVDGSEVTLAEFRKSGRPVVLLFSDPNCGPCTAMLPQLARWFQELSSSAEIVVVSRGSVNEIRAKFGVLREYLRHVLIQNEGRHVAALFQATATPSAVLINSIGLIESYVAVGAEEIEALMAQLATEPSTTPRIEQAPQPVSRDLSQTSL